MNKTKRKTLIILAIILSLVGISQYLKVQDYYKIRHFRTNAEIFGWDLITRDDKESRYEIRYFISPHESPEGEMFLLQKFPYGSDYKPAVRYLQKLGVTCRPLEEHKYSKSIPKERSCFCFYESSFISSMINLDLYAAFTFWHSFFIYIRVDESEKIKSFGVSKYQDSF